MPRSLSSGLLAGCWLDGPLEDSPNNQEQLEEIIHFLLE